MQASDFGLEVNEGMGIGFQGNRIIELEVKSGFLNGSSTFLSFYPKRGQLRFTAVNASTIQINATDTDVSVTGANFTNIGRFLWNVKIKSGDNVKIVWSWRIESWVGKYTMFALGFSGLILMVASPAWVAWQLRKSGIKPEDFERIMYGLLLFSVGFGLLVMWLWS